MSFLQDGHLLSMWTFFHLESHKYEVMLALGIQFSLWFVCFARLTAPSHPLFFSSALVAAHSLSSFPCRIIASIFPSLFCPHPLTDGQLSQPPPPAVRFVGDPLWPHEPHKWVQGPPVFIPVPPPCSASCLCLPFEMDRIDRAVLRASSTHSF
jgi:hypothetical protein